MTRSGGMHLVVVILNPRIVSSLVHSGCVIQKRLVAVVRTSTQYRKRKNELLVLVQFGLESCSGLWKSGIADPWRCSAQVARVLRGTGRSLLRIFHTLTLFLGEILVARPVADGPHQLHVRTSCPCRIAINDLGTMQATRHPKNGALIDEGGIGPGAYSNDVGSADLGVFEAVIARFFVYLYASYLRERIAYSDRVVITRFLVLGAIRTAQDGYGGWPSDRGDGAEEIECFLGLTFSCFKCGDERPEEKFSTCRNEVDVIGHAKRAVNGRSMRPNADWVEGIEGKEVVLNELLDMRVFADDDDGIGEATGIVWRETGRIECRNKRGGDLGTLKARDDGVGVSVHATRPVVAHDAARCWRYSFGDCRGLGNDVRAAPPFAGPWEGEQAVGNDRDGGGPEDRGWGNGRGWCGYLRHGGCEGRCSLCRRRRVGGCSDGGRVRGGGGHMRGVSVVGGESSQPERGRRAQTGLGWTYVQQLRRDSSEGAVPGTAGGALTTGTVKVSGAAGATVAVAATVTSAGVVAATSTRGRTACVDRRRWAGAASSFSIDSSVELEDGAINGSGTGAGGTAGASGGLPGCGTGAATTGAATTESWGATGAGMEMHVRKSRLSAHESQRHTGELCTSSNKRGVKLEDLGMQTFAQAGGTRCRISHHPKALPEVVMNEDGQGDRNGGAWLGDAHEDYLDVEIERRHSDRRGGRGKGMGRESGVRHCERTREKAGLTATTRWRRSGRGDGEEVEQGSVAHKGGSWRERVNARVGDECLDHGD
ncbi:hypothetical protein C8R45DRAFT_1076814 [Mycena sanguinolenta]|nr:hypothetical protein C8R45DRAFT_1076814 [Mycena sanguinolenta]